MFSFDEATETENARRVANEAHEARVRDLSPYRRRHNVPAPVNSNKDSMEGVQYADGEEWIKGEALPTSRRESRPRIKSFSSMTAEPGGSRFGPSTPLQVHSVPQTAPRPALSTARQPRRSAFAEPPNDTAPELPKPRPVVLPVARRSVAPHLNATPSRSDLSEEPFSRASTGSSPQRSVAPAAVTTPGNSALRSTSALSLLTEAFTPPQNGMSEKKAGKMPESKSRVNPFDQLCSSSPWNNEAKTEQGNGTITKVEEQTPAPVEAVPAEEANAEAVEQAEQKPGSFTKESVRPDDAEIMREKALALRSLKTPTREGGDLNSSIWADPASSPRFPALTLIPDSVSPKKLFQRPVATAPGRIRPAPSTRLDATSQPFVPLNEQLALQFYEERTRTPSAAAIQLASSRSATTKVNNSFATLDGRSQSMPSNEKRAARDLGEDEMETITPLQSSSKASISPEQTSADRAKGRAVMERMMSRKAAEREFPSLYIDMPRAIDAKSSSAKNGNTPTPATRTKPSVASSNHAVPPPAALRNPTDSAPPSGAVGFAAQMQSRIRQELLQSASTSDPVAELRALAEMLKEDAEALGKNF